MTNKEDVLTWAFKTLFRAAQSRNWAWSSRHKLEAIMFLLGPKYRNFYARVWKMLSACSFEDFTSFS